VLADVAEAVFEAREQAGALGEQCPHAPGSGAVRVDAEHVHRPAAVDVGDDHDLVGRERGPLGAARVGEAAVQLVDPHAELVADAHEIRGAIAVHVGELPALGRRHRRHAVHVSGVVEQAETRARGDEDAAVFAEDADQIGDAVAVQVGELHARVAEPHPGGRRRDSLGRLITRAVPPPQPDPAVRVVMAQHVDAAVRVHVGERDARVGEVEAQIERDRPGLAEGIGAAAGVAPQLAGGGLREQVLHAVAGEVGES
jgi:hypothetical protein